MANKIQNAVSTLNNNSTKLQETQKQTVNQLMNSLLDSEGMRKRFDELLGKRSAQFVSSLITLVNADKNMQQAFYDSPMTVIQSGLKAATFDLPIEPSLGYAYIMPFKKNWQEDGKWHSKMEAVFVPGYKGLIQLCLRTGAYAIVPDAVDVREGELVSYNRLTGECVFEWEEDDEKREKLPIIGYAGYFRLKNGAEKTIYMTKKQIDNHEKKNRKGKDMSKGWRDDWESMAKKTVIRRLVGKYGLMSIEYKNGDPETVETATELIKNDESDFVETEFIEIDADTGEVVENERTEADTE